MAQFTYEALTNEGRLMKGALEAADTDQARAALAAMNLTVNSLDQAPAEKPSGPVSRSDFLLFNQQLSSLTEAGLPLEKGLREIAAEAASSRVRRLINQIADDLEKGMKVEDAFARQEHHFPLLYGRILQAGIQSGRLNEMLASLNRHIELSGLTRSILLDAMIYPLIVMVLLALITSGIGLFVIPPMAAIYADFGTDLPLLTRGFLSISQDIVWIWAAFFAIIAGVALGSKLLAKIPAGRGLLESIYIHIPLLGRIFRYGKLAYFADAMGLLVCGGSDLPQAMRLGARAGNSQILAREAEVVAAQVERGAGYLEAGQFCTMIPRLLFFSIQVGAQRQTLMDNLYQMSQMYQQQTRALQMRLSSAMLPGLIITVGLFVGLCVVSLFLPMVHMLGSISG